MYDLHKVNDGVVYLHSWILKIETWFINPLNVLANSLIHYDAPFKPAISFSTRLGPLSHSTTLVILYILLNKTPLSGKLVLPLNLWLFNCIWAPNELTWSLIAFIFSPISCCQGILLMRWAGNLLVEPLWYESTCHRISESKMNWEWGMWNEKERKESKWNEALRRIKGKKHTCHFPAMPHHD